LPEPRASQELQELQPDELLLLAQVQAVLAWRRHFAKNRQSLKDLPESLV
jgi:hypothetical protein